MGELLFVVPVRHAQSVGDWSAVRHRLGQTLASIAGQESDAWRCVVVANAGTDLPALPDGVVPVDVDFPLPARLRHEATQEERDEAVRADKGRRVLAGLLAARPAGHVMVVDYDDFVSRRLASLAADGPTVPGWYADGGLVYDGSRVLYRMRRGFDRTCGTSLVVRSDLLDLPARSEDADEATVRRWLGSHIYLKDDLSRRGTPLTPIPFDAAVYRVGTADSASGLPGIRGLYFRRRLVATRPWAALRNLTSIRLLTRARRREFSL